MQGAPASCRWVRTTPDRGWSTTAPWCDVAAPGDRARWPTVRTAAGPRPRRRNCVERLRTRRIALFMESRDLQNSDVSRDHEPAACHWSLVTGHWSLVTGNWRLEESALGNAFH